ncbi:Lsr2 family protein [Streptomyces sp. CBMA29]|uniref:Lsr2 family DNA-binding protein n=1 Tax=Streptomyces sp. CBMA29 TaxID=1896314 RepID=UPI001661A502|nr:Lsr2 family protein [Streptomyces sp. CBMA29]
MEPDPEEVRAYMVAKGMRRPDEDSAVTPPEVRFFLDYKHRDDAREAAEAQRRRQQEASWKRAKAAQQAAWEHKEHMRKAREWGRENGHRVGTRGRIAAVVWSGYQQAMGISL